MGWLLKDDLALSTELKMKLVTVCFKLQSFVRANTEFDVSMFFVGTFAMKVVQFTAY